MTIQMIEECEKLLRAGRLAEAAAKIKTMGASNIPREFKVHVANLCRRAQMDSLALRVLAPVVRSDNPAITQPRSEEIAEYAAGLQKIGAVNEAIHLLTGVDRDQVPTASLYLAFCLFRQWDYEGAIPHLEHFVSREEDAYRRLVGRVNLAAAMASRDTRAHAVVDEAMSAARDGRHSRLLANCHEIRAQIHAANREFAAARTELKLAHGLLPQGMDAFFVRKWTAVVDALESGRPAPLLELAPAARAQSDWETLREIDLFRLKIEFDRALFERLMFGTPFEAYRARAERDLGVRVQSESFLLGQPGLPCFDAASGEGSGAEIKYPGKTLHQMLAILLSDFYKPWSLGEIFSQLFPKEYYNAFSSANRVHQLLWRLRKWLGDNRIPARLAESGGRFHLEMRDDFAFVVPYRRVENTQHALELHKIKRLFGTDQWFSQRDVRSVLNISSATFKRLAAWAVREQHFQRSGNGRATIYRIAG